MQEVYSKARIAKDRNFDGTFLFGVSSTGIFCKPSCPAPVAKEENVRYFKTMFEALEAGYRPCLRCRPDVTVEYHHRGAQGMPVVNEALQLMSDGWLGFHSLEELAERLGVSDRHLRQLFVDNLGAPPVKIAQYHKALFARKMLLTSSRNITDIALAAGFGSTRQFNEVFMKIYEKTPTSVRSEAESNGTGQERMLLPYERPFDFEKLLGFLRLRAIKGVELVTDTSYSRTFRTDQAAGFFTVCDNSEQSALELSIECDDIRCFMEIHNRVRRMFDLDTDLSAINAQLVNDPLLRLCMADGCVPRLPRAFDGFEFVVRAILGQQISVKAATTIAGRIAAQAGLHAPKCFADGLDWFFPCPEELAGLELDGLGLAKTRQATVRAATQAVLDGSVALTSNQPFEMFHKSFSAVKGIGDWTVNYVAMRGLGMLDCFPASDLGVLRALGKDGQKASVKEAVALAEKWRPYRSYATLCLWNLDAGSNG